MLSHRTFSFLLGLSLSLFTCVAVSAEVSALQQLDSLLADMDTLTADVTQLIIESDGGILEESEIRMKMKRPDGFYWETVAPFPELIVTDGQTLWNYQPDLEQVVIEDWDTERSELAAQLLNGETENLALEYEIAMRDPSEESTVEFDLYPLDANSVYGMITLTFLSSNLDMIYIESTNGQKTVWRFLEQEKNLNIADEVFVFNPPAGIEVIQNSYTQ
jgi:outer membrane lipoprotein carrier protein